MIDSGNVEMLVAEMKRAIGQEAHAHADARVKTERAKGLFLVAAQKRLLHESEASVEKLGVRFSEAKRKIAEVSESVIDLVNTQNRRRRQARFSIVVVIFLSSQLLAAYVNILSGRSAMIVSLIAIILATIVQFVDKIREAVFGRAERAKDWAVLNATSLNFSLYDLEDRVDYDAGVFTLRAITPELEMSSSMSTQHDLLDGH